MWSGGGVRALVCSLALCHVAGRAVVVYSARHWFTDVALGALYGITAAKIVNGRWRIFGWRPPTVIVEPGGRASLLYSMEF